MRSRRLGPALVATVLAGCAANTAPPPVALKAPGSAGTVRVKTVSASSESAQVLVRKGTQFFDAGDIRSAARSFEQALVAEPKNRTALYRLALIAERMAVSLPRPQSSPFYLRSAEMMRRLRGSYSDLSREESASLPNILYNEACTFAIDGESGRAIAALAESIDAGFVDIAHIEVDPELDTLRRVPEFQLITRRLEKRIVLAMLAGTKPTPFPFALNDLDGKPVTADDFRGKVLVVDFWGTWCPPCRKQVPNLVALDKRFHDRGLAVVGLTYENEQGDEARKVVRAFAREVGLTYPCLIGTEAVQNQVPAFAGFPTTLFLDRSGKIRLRFSGYQPLSTFEIAAEALLGEPQGKGQEGKGQEKKPGKNSP